MKIGVMSDTHGNVGYVDGVVDRLKKGGVGLVIHLGDDVADIAGVNSELPLLMVPGVYEECYSEPEPAHRIIKEIEGFRFLLSHTLNSHPNDLPMDLKPEELRAKKEIDVVLYGHTHVPEIREEEGILLVNPGHLKTEDKKGFPPSYAVLNCQTNFLKAEIIDYRTGEVLFQKEFKR